MPMHAETPSLDSAPVAERPASRAARIAAAWVPWILVAVVAGLILHGAYAAFTWKKFQMSDYGLYTNMIWNCGHGRMFRFLVDGSYMQTHLSFTLALLGPLFWVWDHPFLLSAAQWLLAVGGLLVLARTAARLGLSAALPAALALALVCSPLFQSILLCEFHGVALLLFLVPWLHYELQFRKRWVWLPLVLILGLREDAFLAVLPLLAYFAVRDRWRWGWILAGASLAYGLLALQVLFPWLAGQTLIERRPFHLSSILDNLANPDSLKLRGWALLWVALPVLPVIRWSRPAWIFASVALAVAILSPFPAQHALRYQYSAAILACLSAGLVEAAARLQTRSPRVQMAVAAGWLAVGAVSYFAGGYLPGGARADRVYRVQHLEGPRAVAAARQIPRAGVLMTESSLAGFCANRYDLLTWERWVPARHVFDLCFLRLPDLVGRHGGEYRSFLESGEFGTTYFDGTFIVLERGRPPDRNAEVLRALEAARRGPPS